MGTSMNPKKLGELIGMWLAVLSVFVLSVEVIRWLFS